MRGIQEFSNFIIYIHDTRTCAYTSTSIIFVRQIYKRTGHSYFISDVSERNVYSILHSNEYSEIISPIYARVYIYPSEHPSAITLARTGIVITNEYREYVLHTDSHEDIVAPKKNHVRLILSADSHDRGECRIHPSLRIYKDNTVAADDFDSRALAPTVAEKLPSIYINNIYMYTFTFFRLENSLNLIINFGEAKRRRAKRSNQSLRRVGRMRRTRPPSAPLPQQWHVEVARAFSNHVRISLFTKAQSRDGH